MGVIDGCERSRFERLTLVGAGAGWGATAGAVNPGREPTWDPRVCHVIAKTSGPSLWTDPSELMISIPRRLKFSSSSVTVLQYSNPMCAPVCLSGFVGLDHRLKSNYEPPKMSDQLLGSQQPPIMHLYNPIQAAKLPSRFETRHRLRLVSLKGPNIPLVLRNNVPLGRAAVRISERTAKLRRVFWALPKKVGFLFALFFFFISRRLQSTRLFLTLHIAPLDLS